MARTYWAGHLQPGEIALFHFRGKTRIHCDAAGNLGSSPPVKFAGIEEARKYAGEYLEGHPDRGCILYDSAGNRVDELRGAAVPAIRYSRSDARRDLIIGLSGFLLIPIGFLVDEWIGWSLFLGMALGTKFVLLGIIKTTEGLAGLMESRKRP